MSKWIFKQELLVATRGTEVELRPHLDGKGADFKLIASRYGVTIEGTSPVITGNRELQTFARAMGFAWNHHKSLKATGKPLDTEPDPEEVPDEANQVETEKPSGHNEGV